ncbi:MAG: type III polyketide synthase [Alphaproteobacteria bacterium]|nr:type III polyketide synthase [Alphaproteobacteria bacterium]
MRIASVGSAMPANRYSQGEIAVALEKFWEGRLKNPKLLHTMHERARVDFRHLACPHERYPGFASWGETNRIWFEVAQDLGARALDQALEKAGMGRHELNALIVVSITGVASPSLDARLINTMGLRPDIKRTPIFGVGCVGGALGLTRAADHVLAYPTQTAALLSVELCSLTLQREDLSTANLISAALFGDGAAAAIVAGPDSPAARRSGGLRAPERAWPRILGSGSVFYPGTEDIMGWDISEKGFRIVLSARLPDFIRANLAANVDAFLARYDLQRSDIGNWVIHTGGPKVIEAIQDSLALRDQDVAPSWDCLRQYGNLSSTSVLLVLEDVMANRRPEPGTLGLLLAMGPGFCSELILLQW